MLLVPDPHSQYGSVSRTAISMQFHNIGKKRYESAFSVPVGTYFVT